MLRLSGDPGVAMDNEDPMIAISAADVIAVFLLPHQLERLIAQFENLKQGACIVSHQFAIPSVALDKILEVQSRDDGESHKLFLWTAPIERRKK